MMLHSGYADHPHSRSDIVVADPRQTLVTHGDVTTVSHNVSAVSITDDPLTLLQQAMDRLNISDKPLADLPFIGGAVGLFGYDLGRRFETLPEQALQDIGVPDMAVGIYDWALIVATIVRLLPCCVTVIFTLACAGWNKPDNGAVCPDLWLAVQYEPRAVR
ncbi:hypothetical protein ACLK1Y_10155 [Escherichia coli]